ncbi:Serine/threonine-protein kinase/endoribonuclease IRE2, partial [Orchesella cincta]
KSGVLSLEEVNDLQCITAHGDRVYKFYNILLTREHGYIKVMEALKETNQSGALEVLRTELTKYKAGIGNKSFSYDVTDLLGKGSYDTIVCKGKWDNRDVAVKRINSDNFQSSKISMEIKNLIACDNHENVIRYFHTEIENNYVLLVLELCDMNLKDWIQTKDIPISSREVIEQVTAGLGWLHHQCRRIVHRDLKPENILLVSHQKRVKLSDFGLSRQIPNDRNSVSTYGCGTQGWIAPEILQQKMVDGKCKFTTASDVFSLGCLWYYVLTDGKHPFGDAFRRDVNILDGKVMIEGTEILHVCAQNVLFIQQMVSTDPASRPSCAALQASTIFWAPEREEKFISEASTSSVIDSSLDENQLLAAGTCKYFHEHCCSITSLYIKLQNIPALKKYYAENAAFNYHFPMKDGNLIQNGQIPTLIDQQNSDTAIPAEPDTKVSQLFETVKTGDVNNSVKVVENLREQNINLTEIHHQVMKTQDFPMSDGNMTETEEMSPLVDPYSSDVAILVEPDTKVSQLFETVKTGDAHDSMKLVENLLEQNINLTEMRHQEMKTLLHAAVKFQSLSFVSYLIEKQGFDEVLCDPDMRDLIHRCVAETKCKPLHWIKQKKQVMFYLHQRKPELFTFLDMDGRTPIFCQNIHPRLLKVLHMLKLQKSRLSFLMCRGVGNFKQSFFSFNFIRISSNDLNSYEYYVNVDSLTA